jgi:hypothetical protein
VEGFEGAKFEFGLEKVRELGSNFLEFFGVEFLDLAADAAEAPFGAGHFADGALFGEVRAAEVVEEFVEEGVELRGVVAGGEGGAGAEAVAEAILGGAGFAFRGAGSGGFLCVGAIGLDLGRGSHGREPSFRRI